jgi:hypothetical protein
MSSDIVEQLSEMEQVAQLFLKSQNPTQIANKLGIPRTRVLSHLESWRSFVHSDMDIRARAKETLAIVDQHYTLLLTEAWGQLEEAKNQNSVKDATGVIKLIASIEKDRADLYQKAGLTADDELADQLAEAEERQNAILDIIKDVAKDCKICKAKVYSAIAELKKEPVVYEHLDG